MKKIHYKFNTKNLNKIFNIKGEYILEDVFMVDNDGGCNGEKNGFYNKKHTEETKKIIAERTKYLNETNIEYRKSRANYGEKNGMYGSARFGELNPMYGKTHNEETIRKISENIKKYYENNPNPNLGKSLTEEQKNKISEKNSKEFKLINPEGEVIYIKNLTKFAKENNLNIGSLRHVVAGRNKSHKGWRRHV